jgi:valyl-tRNA synthetase
MDSRYNHADTEENMYALWEAQHVFTPPDGNEAKANKQHPYTIIMPPPNANDPLHVGHAMFVTVEDILIRHKRMQGFAALWLPGTDHAGIETQYVFEKKLAKTGKSRFQFDRKTLFSMIWEYVAENSGTAVSQMKQLGASADWSRQKFTLDDDCVALTLETFEKLHKDGLLYREERLVNYCTKCGTAYSELEINHIDKKDQLYFVAYAIEGNVREPLVVATVRPETIFADVAIAIHPTHPRAAELLGKKVINPLNQQLLPVITDEVVDPEFGTGALKITPAHDHTDYDIGKRHNLPLICAIGFDGKLNEHTKPGYTGLKVLLAREKAVAELDEVGALVKTESYDHAVGTCYRCGLAIEPLPLAQFFISVKPLVDQVLIALEKQETVIYGAGHDKILRHWLTNLKDWNISRQIVWGIRMPVWYKIEKLDHSNQAIVVKFVNQVGEMVTGFIQDLLNTYPLSEIESGLQTLSAPKEADYVISREKPGDDYLQETDTFDTWFSSAQWPVNTLKTSKPGDFDFYYPTSVMETGYDILPFWVMRMMLMGQYLTGKMPFEKVYLHGLVRDEKGQKMSKSKGNVMNPLDLVEKYGADALRMALVMSTTAGHDSAMGETKVRGMRNFTNKIWNAARFVKLQLEEKESPATKQKTKNYDGLFRERLEQVVRTITKQLDDMKIGLAAETAHNEFWHWFCDEAIEQCKRGEISIDVLYEGLLIWLKLLHPFMPFVTESIWQEISTDKKLLAIQSWPN